MGDNEGVGNTEQPQEGLLTGRQTLIIVLLSVCTGFCFFLRAPLFESYWLDETISLWVTSGTVEQTIQRAWRFQAQSPFYFVLLWIVRQLFGDMVLALRLFAIVPFLLSLWCLVGVLRVLGIQKQYAVIAPLVILFSDALLLRYSFGLRPYTLAFLTSIASIWMLLLWMRAGGNNARIVYAVTFVFSVHFHYLFALAGLIHLSAFVLFRQWSKISLPEFFLTHLYTLPFFTPAILHIIDWSAKASMLSHYSLPSITTVLANAFPVDVLALLSVALLFTCVYAPLNIRVKKKRVLLFGVLWVFAVPLVLYIASILTLQRYFVDRYFIWRTGGLVVMFGWLLQVISHKRAHFLLLSSYVALAGLVQVSRIWHVEDWRNAAHYVSSFDEDTSVFLNSGLIELSAPKLVVDSDEMKEYLTAPFQVYPVFQRVHPLLPSYQSPFAQEQFEQEIIPVAFSSLRTILVFPKNRLMRKHNGDTLMLGEYYRSLFSLHGFRYIDVWESGLIGALVFERPSITTSDREA